MMRRVSFLVVWLMFWSGLHLAEGHQVPSVELEFLELEDRWQLAGEMDIAYMLPETRGIPGGLPLKRSVVMESSPEEFARIRKETEVTLRKLIRITFAEREVAWRVEFPDFRKEPFGLPPEVGDIALISTQLVMEKGVGEGELRVHWSGEKETELITLDERSSDGPVSTLAGNSVVLLKQVKAAGAVGETEEKTLVAVPVERPFLGGWVQSGFSHVLPEGLDHILFILGLFLLVPRWKPLMAQSLLFTVAHTVTLGLSVYGVVSLPSRWVEIAIALSIAWIGLENLWLKRVSRWRALLVFGFGLVHGLGFASVLMEKLDGVPVGQRVWPLIFSNVGIELAQVTVLALAFLALWPLRRWTNQVQVVGSVCVAVAGLVWVYQRWGI